MVNIGKIKEGLTVWIENFLGDPDTRIQVRNPSPAEWKTIKEISTEITLDAKTKEQTVTQNETKYFQALADCVVLAWAGFVDGAGEPYPCTPENRLELMQSVTEFNILVRTIPLELSAMLALDKEQNTKNS